MLTRRALVASWALVVLVVLVVLVGGCAGSDAETPSTTTQRSHASTTRPPVTQLPTTTTTISLPGPPLDTLMLEDSPNGLSRKPNTLADTGPTDLAKAVRSDPLGSEGDARAALESAGFLRGHQRQWSTEPAVSQNFLYVYQFATPEGAESYLSRWRDVAFAGNERAAPVPFTPSMPGAIGLRSNDEHGSSAVVMFSKGVYAVQAVATSSPGNDQGEDAGALAFAQSLLLP